MTKLNLDTLKTVSGGNDRDGNRDCRPARDDDHGCKPAHCS